MCSDLNFAVMFDLLMTVVANFEVCSANISYVHATSYL